MEHITEAPPGASAPGQAAAPASPSGQKRPRDYGGELKGLTSDEDNQDPSSPPASKKKKTRHSDGDSGSESLDDGEIVELSSPRPGGAGHDVEMRVAQSYPKSGTISNSFAETEASVTQRSTQQSSSGFNRGVSLGSRTSFGKGVVEPFSTTRPMDTNAPNGSASDRSSPPSSSREEDAGQGQQTVKQSEAPATDPAEQAEPNPDNSLVSFNCGKSIWQIPRLEVLDIPLSPSAQSVPFWREQLLTWIVAVLQTNEDRPWDQLNYKTLRVGLDKYVSKDAGFLQGAKKHTAAVRKALSDATSNKKALSSMIQRARKMAQKGELPAGDGSSATQEDQHIGSDLSADEERQLQQKYFPNADDPSQHCISCSGTRHRAKSCPQLICRFCDSPSHTSLNCPAKQRCAKCRQLGHGEETCTEKLALAADEQDPCAFCGADHLENECSEVWRSYDPANAAIKKVKAIPGFCYTCGAEGHYGPECALPGRGANVTGRTSWSRANRDLYVDPQSDLVAIGWVGVDMSTSHNGTLNFHIRGRATRTTHNHFVSSEESDNEFIQEPVKKPQARGQIRIASNVANTSRNGERERRGKNGQNHRRHNEPEFEPPPPLPQDLQAPLRYSGSSSAWQPPLPQGPLPPMPTHGLQGSTRSLPTAPPGSLPPHPGSFKQGNGRGRPPRSQNGRGGRGFRGARGGRRGSGRGRGQ
ncbi:hypothetical protein DL766_004979 [Monosporascus sp. MC13-8B]|nr:hypothetical protein DL763_006156 [Monosporascus cannonballus]RYP30245.1 hypothetical protein DL766_004979 [Monosporascus sp. MC13-8B]